MTGPRPPAGVGAVDPSGGPPPRRPAVSAGCSASYRVDWWLPRADDPGEWTGRWAVCLDAGDAREMALRAVSEGAALGLALIARLHPGGGAGDRVAADAGELEAWRVERAPLPDVSRPSSTLPPCGREDLELSTLRRCRDALADACDADLLEPGLVTAIVEIIHQAFGGCGPAVEAAADLAGPSPRLVP